MTADLKIQQGSLLVTLIEMFTMCQSNINDAKQSIKGSKRSGIHENLKNTAIINTVQRATHLTISAVEFVASSLQKKNSSD